MLQTKSCTSSPCGASFDAVVEAGQYSITIMPPYGGGAEIYNLNRDVSLALRPYDLPVGKVNIFGNSKLRTSNIIVQQTSVLLYYRMHKIFVAANNTKLFVTARNLVPDQVAYITFRQWDKYYIAAYK